MATASVILPSDRIRVLLKYAYGDGNIGVPWDLFEAYVAELESQQLVQISHNFARNGLAAPVPGAHPLKDGEKIRDYRFVYPVIK